MSGARSPSQFDLVTLRNGQRAVRHLPSGELMHPSVGPWEEANRLYVQQLRLRERLQASAGSKSELDSAVRVLDVGLGAGTNAMAALEAASELGEAQGRRLELVSFERDLTPLKLALSDPEGFGAQAKWSHAAQTLVEHGIFESPRATWRLRYGDFLECLEAEEEGRADLVFFDPFSPHVNPKLWTPAALSRVWAKCRVDGPGAQVATYSAATPTRVSLLLAGFFVGVGVPVGSKRETTVASTVNAALASPLDEAFLRRWRRSSARAPHGEVLTPELEQRIEQHSQFRNPPCLG